MKKRYNVFRKDIFGNKLPDKNSPVWKSLETAAIDNFHSKSSDHRPQTTARIAYNDHAIFLLFEVDDQYIRSTHTRYNSKVNEDSCVEWFIKPEAAEGYYNFEMNAGGILHVNYIIDPERDENGKRKDIRAIPEDHAKMIEIKTDMPRVIEPEITSKESWCLIMMIPFMFFDYYTPIKRIDSSIWQGNLYKCGDKTSHPHWAAWSPVRELNFHQPQHFGEFIFSPGASAE